MYVMVYDTQTYIYYIYIHTLYIYIPYTHTLYIHTHTLYIPLAVLPTAMMEQYTQTGWDMTKY